MPVATHFRSGATTQLMGLMAIIFLPCCQTAKKSTYANKSIETCNKPLDDAVYATGTDISVDLAAMSAKKQFELDHPIPATVRDFLPPYLIAVCREESDFKVFYGVEADKLNSISETLERSSASLDIRLNPSEFLKDHGTDGFLAARLKKTSEFYKGLGLTFGGGADRLAKAYEIATGKISVTIISGLGSSAALATEKALLDEGYTVLKDGGQIQIEVRTSIQALPATADHAIRLAKVTTKVSVLTGSMIINQHVFEAKGAGLNEEVAAADGESQVVRAIQSALARNFLKGGGK